MMKKVYAVMVLQDLFPARSKFVIVADKNRLCLKELCDRGWTEFSEISGTTMECNITEVGERVRASANQEEKEDIK